MTVLLSTASAKRALSEAIAEYDRLVVDYGEFGYEGIILPKVSVVERADVIPCRLAEAT